jgi:hypothetical protein
MTDCDCVVVAIRLAVVLSLTRISAYVLQVGQEAANVHLLEPEHRKRGRDSKQSKNGSRSYRRVSVT